jgi:hypothetical protein
VAQPRVAQPRAADMVSGCACGGTNAASDDRSSEWGAGGGRARTTSNCGPAAWGASRHNGRISGGGVRQRRPEAVNMRILPRARRGAGGAGPAAGCRRAGRRLTRRHSAAGAPCARRGSPRCPLYGAVLPSACTPPAASTKAPTLSNTQNAHGRPPLLPPCPKAAAAALADDAVTNQNYGARREIGSSKAKAAVKRRRKRRADSAVAPMGQWRAMEASPRHGCEEGSRRAPGKRQQQRAAQQKSGMAASQSPPPPRQVLPLPQMPQRRG